MFIPCDAVSAFNVAVDIPNMDSREQLPNPNTLEGVEACDWSQLML
jgi:hypothetical protein